MKNYLLPLLLCFVTVHSKAVVPEPPRMQIGPFDIADNNTSPIGEDQKVFEGDIIDNGRRKDGKIGEAGSMRPWPGAVIPISFDCSVENIDSALKATEAAIAEWELHTCVRFVKKRPQDKNYLEFIRAAGCWATYVGYKGKKTQISIGNGCDYKHVMVHELGHVIGFWHEQSREDRDKWISINSGNVIPSLLYNFNKVPEQTNNYGEDYDYASIMHYPWNAFAVDKGRNTITPIKPLNGKRPYIKLSASDIAQTRTMYDCDRVEAARASASNKMAEAKKRMPAGFTLAGPNCQDGHQTCADWAEYGHCKLAPDPMLTFCAKSCDNCGPCVDDNLNCEAWAEYGYCSAGKLSTIEFMLRNCKLSCSVCSPDPTTRPTTKATTTQKPTTTRPPTTTPEPTTTTPAPTTTQIYTTTSKSDRPTVDRKGRVSTPIEKFTGVLCKDHSKYCKAWQRDGRCLTDSWVHKNCMLSCKRFDVCDQKMIKPIGVCAEPLGVHSSKIISPQQLYGSSIFYPGNGWRAPASAGRLYNEDDHRNRYVGAWCASPRSQNSYFQIDFRERKRITAFATQGRDVYFEHVKALSISYSDDRSRWYDYEEEGATKIFDANCDHSTPVLNLMYPITARFIRFNPVEYFGAACLRVEVYGC